MAKITLKTRDDFKGFIEKYKLIVRPDRYVVVTDKVSKITLVPLKTSRHLHYLEFQTDNPKEVEELLGYLEKQGFTVVTGDVTFIPG